MQISMDNKLDYGRVITKLSILTCISAFGCMMLGYLILPFASAFFAALLVYENPSKRILSYALPIGLFTVNFFLNGLYSLEGIIYVVIGVIIYFVLKKNVSKGEAAFWISTAVVFFIIVSLVFTAFKFTGSVGVLPVKQYYSNLYVNFKKQFIETVTSLKIFDDNGAVSFAYNAYEAEQLFRELVVSFVTVIIVFAFTISGVTLKLFASSVAKYSSEDSLIYKWDFKTSNIVAIFYVAVSLISMMTDYDGSAFAFVVIALNTLFSAIFAYIGVRFIFYFILSKGKSVIFAVIAIAFIFILLSSFAMPILSYIGVYINAIMNRENRLSSKRK